MDRFRVDLISATPNPQQCVYAAMHQDYSEDLLPLIAPTGRMKHGRERSASNACWRESGATTARWNTPRSCSMGLVSHSVMQQARTHRVGVSFDVQ